MSESKVKFEAGQEFMLFADCFKALRLLRACLEQLSSSYEGCDDSGYKEPLKEIEDYLIGFDDVFEDVEEIG